MKKLNQQISTDTMTFAKSDLLSRAFVETPCPTSWDKMKGSDTVRFCHLCHLNVYNIANLNDKEAEAVLSQGKNGGRVCALLYKRPDGTVVTDNCPRALRKMRDASLWLKAKVIAATTLTLALFSSAAQAKETNSETKTKTEQTISQSDNSKPPQNLPMPGGISFIPPTSEAYCTSIKNTLEAAAKRHNLKAPFPVVQFAIQADGKIADLKIKASSKSEATDKLALKVVSESAPWGTMLPPGPMPRKITYDFTKKEATMDGGK